ncbi:Fc.00g016430.m01.CDS01 [Cosmosporella sp. VM-42]
MPSYSRHRTPGGPTKPRRRVLPRPLPASYMGAVASSAPACNKADEIKGFSLMQPQVFDLDFQAFPEPPPFAVPSLYLSNADEPYQYHVPPPRAASTISSETSSAGSLLSPIQTDNDTLAGRSRWSRGPSPLAFTGLTDDSPKAVSLVCLGRQCQQTFACEDDLTAHVKAVHTHTCNWAGCDQPSFASRDGLIWHVKAEHLLVCPSPGCTETSFQSTRVLHSHIAVAHPEAGKNGIKEWQLSPIVEQIPAMNLPEPAQSAEESTPKTGKRKQKDEKGDAILKELLAVTVAKRKCQDQLRSIVEKKAKKNASTPRSADSPTDLIRGKASRLVDTASFPLAFEHAILPFLSEFLPKWAGPRHVISVTRGKTPQHKRICVMTQRKISRARKLIIAGHVQDLLPENIRHLITFVFSVGQVNRTTWAKGLSKDHMDDICAPRNPYFFRSPCMGDSIGITSNGSYNDSTATLGPCLIVGGGSFWLGNFHPFLDAYQHSGTVEIEHPSREDRTRCIDEGHDAMAQEHTFKLGDLEVTSGLNLQTTRVSHDPYWEEMDKEQPLVVTDWALIASRTSHSNLLRRFPSETQPMMKEALVKSTTRIVPGADVVSSGRTSGYQRGQICEIPAYVSGDENGTQKATREWFIEEPYPCDDEDAWIRGGIGVEGDSGAAVVDASSNALIGHLWGRNRYWGPGPRHTFFTPIADVFDDIQEKCGQQTRPQLPQHRDEADRYPVHPTCRQCYDLRTYLDSRRSSRMSLQSMIIGRGDGDPDLTSIEAASELATPRDSHRFMGIEEASAPAHQR